MRPDVLDPGPGWVAQRPHPDQAARGEVHPRAVVPGDVAGLASVVPHPELGQPAAEVLPRLAVEVAAEGKEHPAEVGGGVGRHPCLAARHLDAVDVEPGRRRAGTGSAGDGEV